MIIKSMDNKEDDLNSLEQLLKQTSLTPIQKNAIEKEIYILRAGIKGEKEASYFIDFNFKSSKNNVVLHDLRLDINGRVAQIDHLIINRSLMVFVLETKHFNNGIKINDNGEFLRWNDYKKNYEGIASPIAQNERHIAVLKDTFNLLDMPTRMGMRLKPTFMPYVLVSASSRIERPPKLDTSQVVKADALANAIDQKFDKLGIVDTFGALARVVSPETLEDIAHKLCALHSPIVIDYKAKFGLGHVLHVEPPVESQQVAANVCRHCSSNKISIQYGKFGYYFKCLDCDGNTAIKVACEKDGCKARIRKDGNCFYRECNLCNSSNLFFTNS